MADKDFFGEVPEDTFTRRMQMDGLAAWQRKARFAIAAKVSALVTFLLLLVYVPGYYLIRNLGDPGPFEPPDPIIIPGPRPDPPDGLVAGVEPLFDWRLTDIAEVAVVFGPLLISFSSLLISLMGMIVNLRAERRAQTEHSWTAQDRNSKKAVLQRPVSSAEANPDYEAWSQVQRLELWQAACLWADEEPALPVVRGPAYAYLRMMKEAITKKELITVLDLKGAIALQSRRLKPNVWTVVTRDSLTEFARDRGLNPRFLFLDGPEQSASEPE